MAWLSQQAENNFQTLINTLSHQLDVYRKAEYKKQQGIDEDDEELKKIEEEKKKNQLAEEKAAKEVPRMIVIRWFLTDTWTGQGAGRGTKEGAGGTWEVTQSQRRKRRNA